jgi:hypothetical protein
MFIVVLFVKVSAHEWSKLKRIGLRFMHSNVEHAGVRKTVCQCWTVD